MIDPTGHSSVIAQEEDWVYYGIVPNTGSGGDSPPLQPDDGLDGRLNLPTADEVDVLYDYTIPQESSIEDMLEAFRATSEYIDQYIAIIYLNRRLYNYDKMLNTVVSYTAYNYNLTNSYSNDFMLETIYIVTEAACGMGGVSTDTTIFLQQISVQDVAESGHTILDIFTARGAYQRGLKDMGIINRYIDETKRRLEDELSILECLGTSIFK